MSTDRRSFLKLAGLGAAGAAVPSLEAATTNEFHRLSPEGRVAAVDALRRPLMGAANPFLEPPAPIDLSSVDWNTAHPGYVKDAVERPFTYYIPVAASGNGANGSTWKTLLQGRNTADDEADVLLHLTPRGRGALPDDPITDPQYVAARSAIRWDDPLLNLFGASGTGWLRVESSHELDFSNSYTFNQAADGTQQGQGLPVFPATGIMSHARLANAGDIVNFELYGTPWGQPAAKRENLLFWVPPESGAVRLQYTVIGEDGGEQVTGDLACDPGMYQQVNDIDNSLGLEVRPGSRLRLRVHSADGESDVAVYTAVSKVDNLDPLKQDPQTDEGSLDRLVRDELIHVNGGEVNDPAAYTVRVGASSDASVVNVYVDWLGLGQGGTSYDGSGNTLESQVVGQHNVATGSFTPKATATIFRPGFGQVTRHLEGNEYDVVEEQSFIPEGGYLTTKDNIPALAALFGNNVNVVYLEEMRHYGEDDMTTFLDAYTNGSIGQNDPELEEVELDDRVNRVYFRLSTGTTAAWGGFTEGHMRQLRTLYGTD